MADTKTNPSLPPHLNSTVPVAVDGSMGVNMKWLRGEMQMTSYCSTSMTCGLVRA